MHILYSRRAFLAAALLGSACLPALTGCGSDAINPGPSLYPVSVPLPPDATYNTTTRAAGYTITDLGAGDVVAINKGGQVLGTESHAFLWTNGARHYLGVLPGDKGGSKAISLNDGGQALGFSYARPQSGEAVSGPSHAFVWQNGAFTTISGDAAAYISGATKINNAGQVLLVGGAINGGVISSSAILWQAGQVTPLVAIGKSGAQIQISTINNRGQALGAASDSTAQFLDAPAIYRSYLVQNGQVTDLGSLPDRPSTGAALLNDNGQIIGRGSSLNPNDTSIITETYVWQNGQFTVLYNLPVESALIALNNPGQLVGWMQDTTLVRRYAFLYDTNKQTLTDLDATVAKGTGWTLEMAAGINDRGQIIGSGQFKGQARNFLLTPL